VDAQIPQQFAHETNGVSLQTQVTMAVQILILGMLVIALIVWKRRQFPTHGKIMGVATIVSLSSFALVMLPVFMDQLSDLLVDFQAGSLRAQVNIAHAMTGTIAVGLSIFVTGKWAWNRFRLGKVCYQKNLMRATMGAWMVAMGFGILVYLAHVLGWM
jgi:uncharacterized membrane protein YozB (DUF420 family)